MDNIVYTKNYFSPQINKKEILRYAGAGENSSEIDKAIDECIEEISEKLVYKVCFCELPIEDFVVYESRDLGKNLEDCSSVVIFCATVGMEIDRLIARYSSISPLKALLFQAIGAERIESLCNLFNNEITEQKKAVGRTTRPRFSAGYGDFLLDAQKDIFKILEPSKRIGVSLNESLLMSPSKSVTAIIGISDKEKGENIKKCEMCKKTDCEYRRKNENT